MIALNEKSGKIIVSRSKTMANLLAGLFPAAGHIWEVSRFFVLIFSQLLTDF